jgi:DNA-binding beta-propeller fold protein YncE
MRFARSVLVAVLGVACTATPQRATPRPTSPSPVGQPTGSLPGSPSAVPSPSVEAEHARQLVWVAVEDGRRVVKVDVTARRVVARYRVPGRPHNITANEDGVAAALQRAGRIAIIRDGSVMQPLLGGSPHDVKSAGEMIVVANEGAARVDLVSWESGEFSSIRLKANPHDVAVAPGGRTAWATLDGNDDLAVVDLRRETVRYVSTGVSPHDLLFAPDGRLWVTDWSGSLHQFSGRGKLLGTVHLGEEAHHLAFPPRGGEVWVTDHGTHRVFVVDSESRKVLASLRMQGAPHHVAITRDGRWAVVADHDNASVVVFDVQRRKRVARIRVGPGPHGVWSAAP